VLRQASHIIAAIYLVIPLAALAWRFRRRRAQRPRGSIVPILAAGTLLAAGLCAVHGVLQNSPPKPWEILLAGYFAVSFLLILHFLDAALALVCGTLLLRVGRGAWFSHERQIAAVLIRSVLLFAVGLPYLFAAVTTYRPRLLPGDPAPLLALGGQAVPFDSTDGIQLAGVWIPVAAQPGQRKGWGTSTVILCHGPLDGKESMAELAGGLLAGGYNVLLFDFRATGQSGGHITTYGKLERNDVLGAVRWIRQNHAHECRHLYGVGNETGAAALLLAATDDSADGRAIESVAVINVFDDFRHLASNVLGANLAAPVRWVSMKLGMPLVSLQTGADMRHFSLEDAAANLAPRPLLVIQSGHAKGFTFNMGVNVYLSTNQPKSKLWMRDADDDIIHDPDMAAVVRRFFDVAVPML